MRWDPRSHFYLPLKDVATIYKQQFSIRAHVSWDSDIWCWWSTSPNHISVSWHASKRRVLSSCNQWLQSIRYESFRHVIQYLRCGEIDIPITVPMATFLRELNHYDIRPRPGSVRQQRISLGEFDLFVCTCTLVTGLIALTCQALLRNINALR